MATPAKTGKAAEPALRTKAAAAGEAEAASAADDVPLISNGTPAADITLPYNGQVLTFRSGVPFVAHRELRTYMAAHGCAVTWEAEC